MSDSTIWRYDGEWTRIPDPIQWADDEEPLERGMARSGFARADAWGTLGEAEIFQHATDEHWHLFLSFDASRTFRIEVVALPHLIKLLTDIAAIYTASQLSQVHGSLENLIALAGEDADREHKRRLAR